MPFSATADGSVSAGTCSLIAVTLAYEADWRFFDGLFDVQEISFAFRVFAPNFALKLLEGASHFVPHAHVLKLEMEDFSRDPEWVAQLLADPLTLDEVQPVATVAASPPSSARMRSTIPSTCPAKPNTAPL